MFEVYRDLLIDFVNSVANIPLLVKVLLTRSIENSVNERPIMKTISILLTLALPVLSVPRQQHESRHWNQPGPPINGNLVQYSDGASQSSSKPSHGAISQSSSVPSQFFGVSLTSNASSQTFRNSTKNTTFLRGVNIGGWLLLETWLNRHLFDSAAPDAIDQWTFDSASGSSTALQDHWKSYFNQSSVQLLASYGVNALRIPIGFWAYDNSGTPYFSLGIGKGADFYLEQAVGWAKQAGMKVWIDCHGSPGSQNGFDNSGHRGSVDWQKSDNRAKSITILIAMAKKYGSTRYAGTVVGLEIVNEPISWGANSPDKITQFAKDAYAAIKGAATNPDLQVVMHGS